MIGIDPSEVMRIVAWRRCADLISQAALTEAVEKAGFGEIETWTWEPPGRGATTAVQLRARRPG